MIQKLFGTSLQILWNVWSEEARGNPMRLYEGKTESSIYFINEYYSLNCMRRIISVWSENWEKVLEVLKYFAESKGFQIYK